MTVSPKKHTSNFTTSTTNRGVEAKEVEIANIHLDTSMQPSSQQSNRSQPSMDFSRTTSSPPSRDDSASYIQVLVQKQRRRRDTTMAPRLPYPSSPSAPQAPSSPHYENKPPMSHMKSVTTQVQSNLAAGNCFKNDNINENICSKQGGCVACKMWPESLLACPAIAALHQSCGALPERTFQRKENRAPQSRRLNALPVANKQTICLVLSDFRHPLIAAVSAKSFDTLYWMMELWIEQKNNISLWRQMRNLTKGNVASVDGPERLDIYRFETGLATLNVRGSAPTRLERTLRRSARPASLFVAEVLAAPQLLAALPVALLLMVLRTALTPVRDLAVGLVQTVSDFVLKPACALTFNALLQPALSCTMQTSRALRAAIRPLAMAVSDAAEPLARLLVSVRLVHVERRCGCVHPV